MSASIRRRGAAALLNIDETCKALFLATLPGRPGFPRMGRPG